MEEKGKLFLTAEFQLIEVEEIMETENHHLVNTTVIFSSKIYQWMLKSVYNDSGMIKRYLQNLKSTSLQDS